MSLGSGARERERETLFTRFGQSADIKDAFKMKVLAGTASLKTTDLEFQSNTHGNNKDYRRWHKMERDMARDGERDG